VWAPLAVAIDAAGGLVAAADYQGWNRCFGSWDYGTRFVPTRPTVRIYDAGGKELRRFGPETFAEALWCDLAFSADGGKLLAFGHNWTTRGLGGLGFLPADAEAKSLYSLDVRSGEVQVARFPDAIASLAVADGGRIVVGCWDHRVYFLGADLRPVRALADGVDVGAAGLVRVSRDGRRVLVAGADGVVRMLDGDGKESWRNELNASAAHGEKPWTRNQRLSRLAGGDKGLAKAAPGIWHAGGGRTHSDLGNQFVIEAPQGLLLIEANGGLSIEKTWAQIAGSGLDPNCVRYVLLTHEHGDHAPGAYLWRLRTGAKVVASTEMAYAFAHHTPAGMGYGFNPPQPVDVVVEGDQDLTLAGLTVRAIRTPGHTAGSLGFVIRRQDKTFVAIGDLIMPGGNLGYWGSLSFSAQDVLQSLRKVDALKPDCILGGHGTGETDRFIASGIAAGEATGWSKMPPLKPDRYHRLSPGRYLVVAWLEEIVCAACDDVDGDGRPDVAVLTGDSDAAAVKVYLNRKGRFAETADRLWRLGGFRADRGSRLQLVRVGGGRIADVLVASETQAALLLARDNGAAFRKVDLPVRFAAGAFAGDFNRDGRMDLLIAQRFVGRFTLALAGEGGAFRTTESKGRLAPYHNMELVDVNADGRADLATSGGDIFLRRDDGTLGDEPTCRLDVSSGKEWVCLAAGDFNGDGALDLAFTANRDRSLGVRVFQNTRTPREPFGPKGVAFDVPGASVFKDGPTAADWNTDGVADLIVRTQQGVAVLLGSDKGLDPRRAVRVDLDFRPQGDSRFAAADFNGDGKPDLAASGASPVGAIAVYVYLQP
jgi:glyoxylase-like metal-dependent hydrolase (beta-lactamase superfamily II)